MARLETTNDTVKRDAPAASCAAATKAREQVLEFARALARIAAREDGAAERIEAEPAASTAIAQEPKKIG